MSPCLVTVESNRFPQLGLHRLKAIGRHLETRILRSWMDEPGKELDAERQNLP